MLILELEKKLKTSKSSSIPLWLKRSRKDILEWIILETNQYQTKSIMENVYIVFNGEPPKCKCGNYRMFNTYDKGYRIGCKLGNKCLDVGYNRTLNQRATLISTYGVTNAAQLDSSKEKTKTTNLKKYGVEHHSQSASIKEKTIKSRKARTTEQRTCEKKKSIETNLAKYGEEHHMKLVSQQKKVKDSNSQKYGHEFPLQNKASAERMRKSYIDGNNMLKVNSKRKKTFLEKYQVDAASRINLLPKTVEILADADKFKQTIIGKTREEALDLLNIHEHTLYLYAKKYNATELFKRPLLSSFEKEVSEFLDELGISYTQNDRIKIAPNELDFLIQEYNVAIECCGLYWHSENSSGRDRTYHFNKFNKCKELGISLLTIFQDEWDLQKEKVKIRIKLALDVSLDRIYGRNTTVREITTIEAKSFIDEHHLQSYSPASIKLGLYRENELCSVMTFGKSRYNKNYEYELIRFCSTKNVIGGVEKLFSYFVKNFNPTNIISYSDNRYFTGNMYKTLGFLEGENNIGYFYTDYKSRFNRLQFQKHKLVEQGFDKTKSEWNIMQDRKYDRIWDCGQTTWTLNLINNIL